MSTWVLVADSSRARIFESETPSSPLVELETFAHPEGRQHDRDLTSDLPGRNADSSGVGHHAMSNETDPKKQESINFAKLIAQHLEQARTANKLHKLIIVAAPTFLGIMREQLNNQISKLITMELDKNLVQHDINDIRQHLPQYLPGLG